MGTREHAASTIGHLELLATIEFEVAAPQHRVEVIRHAIELVLHSKVGKPVVCAQIISQVLAELAHLIVEIFTQKSKHFIQNP